jgi:hypothetical protein
MVSLGTREYDLLQISRNRLGIDTQYFPCLREGLSSYVWWKTRVALSWQTPLAARSVDFRSVALACN